MLKFLAFLKINIKRNTTIKFNLLLKHLQSKLYLNKTNF